MTSPPETLMVSQRQSDNEKEKSASNSDAEAIIVSDAAEVAEDDDQNLSPGLPFSKARCIALVATLTGASFLNVRLIIIILQLRVLNLLQERPLITHDDRASQRKRWSSSSRRWVRNSASPKPGSSGSSRPTRSPLGASCCFGAGWPTSTGSARSLSPARRGSPSRRSSTRFCRTRLRLTCFGGCRDW